MLEDNDARQFALGIKKKSGEATSFTSKLEEGIK